MDLVDALGWTEEQVLDLRATGYSYVLQGIYGRAILFFEALVALRPESAYDHQILGAIYLQIGEGKKAIEWLDRALDLDPTHNPTFLNKAKALLITGHLDEGLALARSLMRARDPKIQALAEALVMAYE